MKKLAVIVSLIFTVITVNAQLFMGARFNMKAQQINADNGDKKTSEFSFGIYDNLGYRLSNVWDVGMEFGGTIGIYTNHVIDTETTSAHWLFSPYTRFKVIQAGKFDFMGKCSLALEGSKTYFQFGVYLVPVMAYNLNDRIALQTNLNLLSLGLSYNKIKDGDSSTTFHLMGNSNNIATIGDITIGFIYKF